MELPERFEYESGPRHFLIWFVGTIVLAILCIPLINLVVDPFLRFDLVSVKGFNEQKPVISVLARLAKPGAVCRLQPGSIALGTSRVEVGIDPKHPAWNRSYGPIYNLALTGSGLKEIFLTLQHAVHASPRMREVLIGLDFLMFNAHREAAVFGTEVLYFDPKRLMLSDDDSCGRSFRYDLGWFLGTGGLRSSLSTIFGQEKLPDPAKPTNLAAWIALQTPDGYRGESFRVVGEMGSRTGFRTLFDSGTGNGAPQESYYVSRIWRAGAEGRYCFKRADGEDTIALFRKTVDFARKSQIDVRFFINPIHARMLLAIQEAGLWPQYEEWKRSLVDVLAEAASSRKATAFPLWDFSGINTVTTEHIPQLKDLTPVKWWWEPSHYQSAAGDMILDRVLGYSDPGRTVPDDFGILLSRGNIDAWTAVTRQAVKGYAEREPDEAGIVYNAVRPIAEAADGANCGEDESALIGGVDALKRNDRPAAEAAFAKAVAIHAAEQARYAEINVPYRENGFERKLVLARRGVQLAPKLSSWIDYQNRANQYISSGQLEEAVEDLSHAIRLAPPNAALFFLRGTSRLRLGQQASAAEDFVAGLAIDPNNVTLKALLKQVNVKSGDAVILK